MLRCTAVRASRTPLAGGGWCSQSFACKPLCFAGRQNVRDTRGNMGGSVLWYPWTHIEVTHFTRSR
jgi:hypothetical protein